MTKHRLLACLLVLCLLLGSVPAGLAEGGSGSSSDLVQLIREKLNRNNTAEETAPEAPAADAAPAQDAAVQEAPAEDSDSIVQKASPDLPVFIRQPMDRSVRLNALAVMDADVDRADSYQWQYSEDNGLTWNDCAKKFTGAKTIRVLFTAKENMNGWLFRLAASNSAGTVYSDTAVLTIEDLPAAVTQPAAEEPASEEPAAQEPAAQEPAAEEPAAEEPAAQEPDSEEPTAEEPVSEEPAADEPAAEEPASEEPAAEEPVSEEPAAEEPAELPYDPSDPFAQIDDDFDVIEINERITPAVITKDPVPITVAPGSPAKYSIDATGSGTLIYQWQYSWDNKDPWGNLTNSAFWKGNKTKEMEFVTSEYYDGMYIRCAVKVVTAEGSSAEKWSKSVQVHVSKGPTIINQPQDVTVSKDTKTSFTVDASGNGTLSYKWEYRTTPGGAISLVTDNGDMEDSTLRILKVKGKLAFDGYQFRCKVTDSVGSIYTDWATLHIKEAAKPEIKVQPNPLDITAYDGEYVTISLTAVNATKYQWQYDKGEGWKDLSSSTYWVGNKTDTLTFMAAYRHDNMKIRCKVSNDVPDDVYSDVVTIHVKQLPVIVKDPVDQSVTAGTPVTFSIQANGALKYQWQCSYDGGLTWLNLTNSSFWNGNKTDELKFTTANRYNNYLFRCVAINDAGQVASKSAKLTLTKSVVIKQHPQNQVSGTTGKVTFTVVAENAVSYLWERAPVGTTAYEAVPASFVGRNTDTLTVPATAENASYKYRCKVTGSTPGDEKYTTAATITLLAIPNILQEPADTCVNIGQKATFSVSATGATGYQWQYSTDNSTWFDLTNGEFWVGNNASTLSFMAAATYNNFYFRCLVSNAAGTQESQSAKLCIKSMPVIINDPISRNVPVDAMVVMEVVATGATSYTWQYHNGVKWVTLNNTAIWSGVNTYRLVFQAKKYMDGYQFRCLVKNASGTVPSAPALLTVSAVVPPQPNNVNITGAAMSSLTVTWSKVVADELNGYKIYYSTVNDPSTAILYSIVDPTQKSCTIIGLTPMTNYYVWVSAYNTAGESNLDSHVMATGRTMWADTDMIPPEAPTNVKAVALNDYSIRLTWRRSPSAGVLGYLVYYSTQSLTSNAKLYGITGPTATSIVLQGLEPGTRYYIWVAAYDDGGMSLLTNSVLAIVTTTGNPVYPIVPVVVGYLPDPPINVAAQRVSDTEAKVSWKRSASTDVLGYTIYYGLTADPSASTAYVKCDASVRSVDVIGLNPNYGYYFWVVSYNEVGECNMNANNRAYVDVLNPVVVVYPPVGPLSVSAGAISANRIVVSWTSSPSLHVDGYRVYYSTVNNPATAVPFAMADASSNSIGVFGLKPMTLYYFWVTAFNDAGESKLDSTVSTSAWTLY